MPNDKRRRRTVRFRWSIALPFSVLSLLVIVAVFADLLAPHMPDRVHLADNLLPPFWQEGGTIEYPLGTDLLGRDILSRVIYGARISLTVGALGVLVTGSIGGMLGIIAGYYGGRTVDYIVSHAISVMRGIPVILLAMILAIVLGPSLFNVIIVVFLVYWARYARQARADTLKIRTMDYVTLARTAGVSDLTIIRRHILPNVLNGIVVLATFNAGAVITLEASLSFLGCGVPPPAATWGGMCADGRGLIGTAWWVSFWPGLAITLVVLSFNQFGDWVRDKIDPKLQSLTGKSKRSKAGDPPGASDRSM